MNLKFQHEQQNRTEERQEMIKAGQQKKGGGEKKTPKKLQRCQPQNGGGYKPARYWFTTRWHP